MKEKRYDLIGDIHGHHDKATALLKRMANLATGTTWRHPEARKVVFLDVAGQNHFRSYQGLRKGVLGWLIGRR